MVWSDKAQIAGAGLSYNLSKWAHLNCHQSKSNKFSPLPLKNKINVMYAPYGIYFTGYCPPIFGPSFFYITNTQQFSFTGVQTDLYGSARKWFNAQKITLPFVWNLLAGLLCSRPGRSMWQIYPNPCCRLCVRTAPMQWFLPGYDRTDLMSPLLATIPALALPEKRHHSHRSLIRPHKPICQSPLRPAMHRYDKKDKFCSYNLWPRMIRESPSLSDHRHNRIAVRPMGNL